MKRTDIKQMAFAVATALLVVSCANEDMTEGNLLPEGKYPVVINSVNVEGNAQTRVSESADGSSSVFDWDGNEKIGVSIDGNSYVEYTLNDDKSVSAESPLSWSNANNSTVTAYYPYGTTAIDLTDQSEGLKYVMKGEGSGSFITPVNLSFKHQLAKVRVKLKGLPTDEVTSLWVYGYTTCTNTNGDVTIPEGATKGYISMRKPVDGGEYWEANLAPQDISITNIVQLMDKKNATHTCEVSGVTTLEKAKCYVFNIEVKRHIKNGETITESGDYIMTGKYTLPVTLDGDNINLTLEEVTANFGNAIIVKSGSPTLIVKGTSNSFDGDGAGILISPNASVTIKGATDNASDSKLTIKAGTSNQPGIGSANESSCKNITINNVTLDVTGGSIDVEGGAAIGTSGQRGSSVNDILIENSTVTATGGKGAAAIGFGTIIDPDYSINSIKIIDSQITAIVQYHYQTNGYAAGIGFPNAAGSWVLTIKQPIEIESKETNLTMYFSSFKAMKNGQIVSNEIRKVGKPMSTFSHFAFSWQGAKFNGETLGDNNVGY